MSFDTIAEAVAAAAQRTDNDDLPCEGVRKQNSKIRPRSTNTVETPWAGARSNTSGDRPPELNNTVDDVSSSGKFCSTGNGGQHDISREKTNQVRNAVASTAGDGGGGSNVMNGLRVPHPPSMRSPTANVGNDTGTRAKSRLTRARTASASPSDLGAYPGVFNDGGLQGNGDGRDADGCHGSIEVRKKPQHRNAKATGVDKKRSDPIANIRQRYCCGSGGLGSGSASHGVARSVATRKKRGGADSASGGIGGGGTRKSKRNYLPRYIQNQPPGDVLSIKGSCSSRSDQSPRRSIRGKKADGDLSGQVLIGNHRCKVGRGAVKRTEGLYIRQSKQRRRPRLDGGEMTGEGLRSRYDRELLETLEVEQAAESAREKELAKAKEVALLADTRYRTAAASFRTKTSRISVRCDCISSSAPQLEWGDGGGCQRLDDITGGRKTAGMSKEPLESDEVMMTKGGCDDRRGGSSGTPASMAKTGASSLTVEVNQEMIDGMQREAEATARDVEGLEERLARERLAASKRVMKVSEAYENALRGLAAPQRSVETARAAESVS
ncbi:unnamed protein product [Sphacelaria rigidula]